MTEKEAIMLYESRFWESMSYWEKTKFQLFEERLCMPFEVFHEAITKSLGRPVFTHEFGLNIDGLRKEFLGEAPAPTIEEIISMIPADKQILVKV